MKRKLPSIHNAPTIEWQVKQYVKAIQATTPDKKVVRDRILSKHFTKLTKVRKNKNENTDK